MASALVALLGIVALGVAGLSTLAGAATDHCPDHNGNAGKVGPPGGTVTVDGHEITVVIEGNTVTFTEDGEPVEVSFCMKASTKTEGPLTGSSGEFTTLNAGGEIPDISYVVVYGVPTTTTTTTEATTTTTSEVGGAEETTTTTAEVAGVVVEPEPPQAAPEELAFTGVGNSTVLFAALGVMLVSLGIGLAWAGRRELAWVHDER